MVCGAHLLSAALPSAAGGATRRHALELAVQPRRLRPGPMGCVPTVCSHLSMESSHMACTDRDVRIAGWACPPRQGHGGGGGSGPCAGRHGAGRRGEGGGRETSSEYYMNRNRRSFRVV